MTLQDLPLRDLVEMEKTLKILRYTYENPSSPSSTCPLCIMYMDEPAEDSSCTICPHISIDGAEYTEAGMPCKSNQRIRPNIEKFPIGHFDHTQMMRLSEDSNWTRKTITSERFAQPTSAA